MSVKYYGEFIRIKYTKYKVETTKNIMILKKKEYNNFETQEG